MHVQEGERVMNLNEKQQLAVDTIDKNVLLDASAGTGKTTVLVNRFVNILDKGDFSRIRPDEVLSSIVAITFTKKASNELKDRVAKLIYERAKTDESFKSYYNNMPSANVSTVHQFAFKMLKAFPLLANIDPRAKVIEEDEADELLDRAVREALDEKNYEELFKALDKNYDDNFINSFKSIINKTRGMDLAELRANTLNYVGSIYDEDSIRTALSKMCDAINEVRDDLKENSKLYGVIEKHKDSLDALSDMPIEQLDLNLLNDFAYNIGVNAKKKDYYDAIIESASYVLKALEVTMLSRYEDFFTLLESAHNKYKNFKEKEAALDFNDLEILFRDLLKRDEVRETLQNKLSYIMVDEFQDTSPIQKEIYYLLNEALGGDRLFVVGDFKQSIYAFRGADVSLYQSVKEDFLNDTRSTAISMNENYRTGEKIISSVNKLFADEIHDYEDLIFKGDINNSEVKVIKYIEKNDRDLEGAAIANKIMDLHAQGTHFGDIVILVRANRDSAAIEKALKRSKVPVCNTANKALNERDEMEDIYNFIHYLRYGDELSLIGLLRSNFYAIDDDEIFLAKDRDGFKYYKEELEKYVQMKDEQRLDDVLKAFFDETHYIEKLLIRKRGAQSYTNVRSFLDRLSAYYEMGETNFEALADKLLLLREKGAAEPSYISERDDIVRIMTIHKAKGLEAKVVICAQMAFKRSADPSFARLADDKIFLRFKDLNSNFKEAQANDKDLYEEEKIRNLYVMLTRAKEQLIVYKTGGKSGFIPYIDKLDAISEEPDFNERELSIDEEEISVSDDDLITREEIKWKSPYAPLPSSAAYAYDFEANTFKVYDDERDTIEGVSSDNKNLGSAAHRFCEAYEGKDFDEVLRDTAHCYNLSEKQREVLMICAKNYEKFYKTVTNAKTYKEFEYYYTKDDIIYTGVIDRVDVYEDHALIIDYKVTSLDEKSAKSIYATQMAMYMEAARTIFKKEARAKLFLLSRDKLIDME